MRAQCQCGQLAADVPGPSDQLVVCHCFACQRRSGSPFGAIGYYPEHAVTLRGAASEFIRIADSGKVVTTGFCGNCGSTLWLRAEAKPGFVGIPIGLFADPHYAAPARSVYEDSKHDWVAIAGDMPRFPQART